MIGKALAFGKKGGLALDTIVAVLESGPLGSKQLKLKAPILKLRHFDTPASNINTAAKDVVLISESAHKDARPLTILYAVRHIMAAAQADGQGQRAV